MPARSAVSRGYKLAYEDVGRGPAIVLINGLGGPAEEWREAGYVDALSGRYRLVLFDPLGHGASERPHDVHPYAAPDAGLDIVAAMDAAGIAQATLWGYSRGAHLAATAAAECPDRVASLIVGGSTLRPPRVTREPIRPRTKALLEGDWTAFWATLPSPVPEAYRRYYETANDPKALGAATLAGERSCYQIDFGAIRAPTCLYCGAQDAADATFHSELQLIARELGTDAHILPGDHDHFAAFDDAETVLAVVAPYLPKGP